MSCELIRYPIREGALIKLRVPPFSIGLVLGVSPGLPWHGPNSQLLSVMWQDFDVLAKASRIPNEIAADVDSFFSLTMRKRSDAELQESCLCERIIAFVEKYTYEFSGEEQLRTAVFKGEAVFKFPDIAYHTKWRKTQKPVSIIGSHRNDFSIVRLISNVASNEI